MNFLHWKLLFAIIGAGRLLAWALLIFNMPNGHLSGPGVFFFFFFFVRERYFPSFVRAFKQPVVLTRAGVVIQ